MSSKSGNRNDDKTDQLVCGSRYHRYLTFIGDVFSIFYLAADQIKHFDKLNNKAAKIIKFQRLYYKFLLV